MQNILPESIKKKIYKTGQTRGADDDVIYQNRVCRNSTVLIPFHDYSHCRFAPTNDGVYENGYMVLIKPEEFFNVDIETKAKHYGLELGRNMLVFYETREQWNNYPPLPDWTEATSRKAPLGGQYVARIPNTTSENDTKIILGFCSSKQKGAGIRVYEYADTVTIRQCRLQLEYLFWRCKDIGELMNEYGIDDSTVKAYTKRIFEKTEKEGLADIKKLIKARILDEDGFTVCPLCLKHISARGFCSKIIQAEGREVPDLTVTEISLFHIRELRTGEFNHRPYNLGWGHHH